jgi:hypothetical protein
MRIRIPFCYQAVLPPRKGGAPMRVVGSSLEFEVPEISSTAAPVVLRHGGFHSLDVDPDGEVFSALFDWPEAFAPLVDFRLYQGSFYEPTRASVLLEPGEMQAAMDALDPDDPNAAWFCGRKVVSVGGQSGQAAWLVSTVESVHRYLTASSFKKKVWAEDGKTVFSGTTKDRDIEDIRRSAVHLLAIDGVLHRRTSEPVITIFEGRPAVSPLTGDWLESWRLDEVELVAEVLGDGSDAASVAAQLVGRVEIVDPSLYSRLREPFERGAFVAALARMRDALGDRLHDRPMAQVDAFVAARRASADGETVPFASLVAAVELAASALENGVTEDEVAAHVAGRKALSLHKARDLLGAAAPSSDDGPRP